MENSVSEQVEAFFANHPLRKVKKDSIIIYAGTDPPGVIYIVSGQVRQYDITEKGDEVVLNVFKEHTLFPMSWAVHGGINPYFYEAYTDVQFKVAPAAVAVDFIKSHPSVAYDLLYRLLRGVDGLQKRMTYLMGGSGYGRVVLETILQCKRFGVLQSDGTYILPMHEEELANRAGLSRETVSRELSKLKKLNLLSVKRRQLCVHDLVKLEAELDSGL